MTETVSDRNISAIARFEHAILETHSIADWLAALVSVEVIFLTLFVLLNQNRMTIEADREGNPPPKGMRAGMVPAPLTTEGPCDAPASCVRP